MRPQLSADRWGERWARWRTARLVPARLVVLVAVTALCVGFALLLDGVLDGEGVARVDEPFNAFLATHRTRATTVVFSAVTTVGGAGVRSWLVASMVALLAWRVRSWWPVWVGVVALGGSPLFVFAAKQLVERPRPNMAIAAAHADGYSFPSGHATNSLVAFGLLAWLTTTLLVSRRAVVVAVWAVTASMSIAVGASRLYLGVHYLSDVLGGWALGAAWLATVLVAFTPPTHLRRGNPFPRPGRRVHAGRSPPARGRHRPPDG